MIFVYFNGCSYNENGKIHKDQLGVKHMVVQNIDFTMRM